jgi:hypothetical protein
MEALKGLEKPVGRPRIEAGSVVLDEIHGLTIVGHLPKFDLGLVAPGGVLPRIAQ